MNEFRSYFCAPEQNPYLKEKQESKKEQNKIPEKEVMPPATSNQPEPQQKEQNKKS